MIKKDCPYISFETLLGTPSEGTCNLYPEEYGSGRCKDYRFVECDKLTCKFKEEKERN